MNTKCSICSCTKTKLFNNFSFFSVYLCLDCNTLFAYPALEAKALEKTYSPAYYKAWGKTAGQIPTSVKRMKTKTFAKYLDLVENYTHLRNKKLLDVGCAAGYLLQEAEKRGALCYGVEISSYTAKLAQQRLGSKIFCGVLTQARYPTKMFDVVTMTDFIEHTPDPLNVLQEVKRILKPRGYLLIVTPNPGSFWAKIMGKYWTNFKKEHLYYFSDKSLAFLAQKTKLRLRQQLCVKKFLTLDYIKWHFAVYPTPVLAQIAKIFNLVPKRVRTLPFPVPTGDHLVLLQA